MRMHTYTHICARIHTYTHILTYAHVWTRINTYAHKCTHAHAHTCTFMPTYAYVKKLPHDASRRVVFTIFNPIVRLRSFGAISEGLRPFSRSPTKKVTFRNNFFWASQFCARLSYFWGCLRVSPGYLRGFCPQTAKPSQPTQNSECQFCSRGAVLGFGVLEQNPREAILKPGGGSLRTAKPDHSQPRARWVSRTLAVLCWASGFWGKILERHF